MVIEVRGMKYTIVFKDEIKDKSEGFYFGLCEYDKQIIQINNKVSNERVKQTLLHEITHAFHFEYYGCHMFEDKEEFLAEFVSLCAEKIIEKTNEVYKYYLEGETDG